MRSLHYITVATKPHPNLDILLELCKRVNLKPVVLGMSDKRLQSWGEAFGVKLEHILRFCRKVDERDIVLYTDAFDVIPQARQQKIIDAFLACDADLVFGAETACHPSEDLRAGFNTIHPDPGNPHRYLNSGFFIGYAGSYVAMSAEKGFTPWDDDQGYWAEIFLKKHKSAGRFSTHAIKLDVRSTLVMNLFNARHDLRFDKAVKRYKRLSTGTEPCFLHVNGGAQGFAELAAPLRRQRNMTSDSYGSAEVIYLVAAITALLIILVLLFYGLW
jgi:hypothetical protein